MFSPNSFNRINNRGNCLVIGLFVLFVIISLFSLRGQIFNDQRIRQQPVLSIYAYRPSPLPLTKWEFRPIKKTGGTPVLSFYNVCIEDLAVPKLRSPEFPFNDTKKIVVYGKNGYSDGAIVKLNVAGSGNTPYNHWGFHFTHKNLTHGYSGDTAFFVSPSCAGNFHHFFVDEFVPLFSVVSLSNRLHAGSNNHIVYRTPQSHDLRAPCSTARYEGFLKTLYINEFHDVFNKFPSNTCFKQAIFGSAPMLSRSRDLVDHVMRYYNITLRGNGNVTGPYVTVVARKDRRMINTEEVASFVREAGFKNVRIVDFSELSIYDQLLVAATSHVFVGVNGAGMQWSVFMPEGSSIVELGWPHKRWGFYFRPFASTFGINNYESVQVDDVRLNWTSYETNVNDGRRMTEEQKQSLMSRLPPNLRKNIWKWADIFVKKQEIFGALKKTFERVKS